MLLGPVKHDRPGAQHWQICSILHFLHLVFQVAGLTNGRGRGRSQRQVFGAGLGTRIYNANRPLKDQVAGGRFFCAKPPRLVLKLLQH